MPEEPIDLSIIIVNWYSWDYVKACIRSIFKQTHNLKFEIILIDNASFDGCDEKLAKDYPDIIFIQNKFNLGFAAANNLGALHARAPVLLFLNPDTEVLADAIQRLLQQFKVLPDIGVLGCRLLNTNGSFQASSIQSFPTLINQALDSEIFNKLRRNSGLWGVKTAFCTDQHVEVEAVSGACMMVRREIFERVGGYNEDYFMYGEDIDLCFRIRKLGLKNYWCNDIEIIHHGGGSSKNSGNKFTNVMMRESVWLFFRKNYGPFQAAMYRSTMFVTALGRLFILMILIPAVAFFKKRQFWKTSLKKWIAIGRWAIGLESWVKNYSSKTRKETTK